MGFFKRVFLGFFGWVFLGGFFNANPVIDGTQTVFIEPLHLGKDASFGARSIVDKEIAHWTQDPVDPCKG